MVNATPRPLYPRERDPLYRRVGGSRSQPGRVRKISPPPGLFFFAFHVLYPYFCVLFVLAFCLLSLLYNTDNINTHSPRERFSFCIRLYSLLYPSLVLCLDCPAFCPYIQHTTQAFIPPAGFEPATPASDRPQTLALDRSATGIARDWILGPSSP